MRLFFLLIFVLLTTVSVVSTLYGVTPIFVQPSQNAIIPITDPEVQVAYYGDLDNAPHTYEIRVRESFQFQAQIMIPDSEDVRPSISGILIRIPEKRERVQEIERQNAQEVTWEADFYFWEGNTYLRGPLFSRTLEPGTYRFQIYTPDNLEKYVLKIGQHAQSQGYLDTVGALIEVKRFFDKSPMRMIEAGYFYVPVLVLGMVVGTHIFFRRRKKGV